MNFQYKRQEEVDLNITPLIDVVFLLLIFFMVSTTFERESEINITLPEATRDLTEAKPDAIKIAVDAQSHIYINDKVLVNSQLNTIKDALSEAIGNLVDPPVIISADSDTSHQMVVRVMDAARQLGLIRITFATQRIDENNGLTH